MSQNSDEKVRWKEISPQYAHDYFGAWAFTIKDGHRPALGIQSREFMDKEKTEELRVQWEHENPRYRELEKIRNDAKAFYRKQKKSISEHPVNAEWERLKKEWTEKAYKYSAISISTPLVFDFHEGDVFWNGKMCVQVVSPYAPLEVKFHNGQGKVIGYHLTEKNFADWLRTGQRPPDQHIIDKNQSKSAIAQYHEYTQ